MNLGQCVSPETLRIDLSLFEPHAIVIPIVKKRRFLEPHDRRMAVGAPQAQLLKTLEQQDGPISYAQILLESGIKDSTCGSLVVRAVDRGEIIRSGTHRHYVYAIKR